MRLVNADSNSIVSHKIYAKIPQPMPIYHSTEEFQLNEQVEANKVIKKEDLYLEYRNLIFPEDKFYHPVVDTFISTGETFVPLTFTKEGFLLYEIVGMIPKPTDNCYIKLFGVLYNPGGTKYLVTSSGMWSLIPIPRLSAGVPPKITFERGWNMKLNREARAKSVTKIKHQLKTSNKLNMMDYKFISKLLNPLAGDFFLNPMLSAKNSYKPNANPMSDSELMGILASERVQKLILKELKIVMPELAKAIQDQTDPQAIATMLQRIADDTIKKPDSSVEDKLLSVQAILNAGYPDQAVNLNPPREMIAGGMPMGMGLPQPQQNLISNFDQPTMVGGDEVKKPDPTEDEPIVQMTDKEYNEASEDAGAIKEFTFESVAPIMETKVD